MSKSSFPCNPDKTLSINRWKIAGAFFNPNGMYLSGQHNNDVDMSLTKTDQPVVNATNSSNTSQQHRLRKFNSINERYSSTNSVQSRKNDGALFK